MMKSTAACLIWTTGLLHDENGAQNFGLMELWCIGSRWFRGFQYLLMQPKQIARCQEKAGERRHLQSAGRLIQTSQSHPPPRPRHRKSF